MIADILAVNPALTYLDVSNNLIGYGGTYQLGQGLKDNTVLKTLDMSGNKIGYIGLIAIAEVLKTNTGLTHLILDNNAIGDKGVEALAKAMKINTAIVHVSLEDNEHLIDPEIFIASIEASIAENKDPTRRAAKVIAVREAAKNRKIAIKVGSVCLLLFVYYAVVYSNWTSQVATFVRIKLQQRR